MPVWTEAPGLDGSAKMSGTTLCPHCDTRFKIAETQLEAHHGMVRCGHCLRAFDARPGFISDQPNPQLELPILDELTFSKEQRSAAHQGGPRDATPNFNQLTSAPLEPKDDAPSAAPYPSKISALQTMTLSKQTDSVRDQNNSEILVKQRAWPWAMAILLLLAVLLAQAAYFFRVDLAARLPSLKAPLVSYCQMLDCIVPLPQKTDLIGIESSDLEADTEHENQITLNALLRNRAPYTQTFPNLELTLNDIQDKPLARRIFKPIDYLPSAENEKSGLPPNQEFGIKLHLNTTDLKPTGYRLALFYPRQ